MPGSARCPSGQTGPTNHTERAHDASPRILTIRPLYTETYKCTSLLDFVYSFFMAELIGVSKAAVMLGVHANTVRNMVADGRLRPEPTKGTQLRFDPVAVQRLADQLFGASVQPRRPPMQPHRVSATDLDSWDGRVAQEELPRLVRMLLSETQGVSSISVRTGDGIALTGWDGTALSEGSAYLPSGLLRFEIGTASRPVAKASADWSHRVAQASPTSRDEHFIFVTNRRWSGKEAWARKRAAEGVFASVHVLDADDLDGWLENSPRADTWAADLFGLTPLDLVTAARWWADFSARTSPRLTPAMILSGRDHAAERVQAMVRDDTAESLLVQGQSATEAVAFISVAAAEENAPPLVVSTPQAWARAVSASGRLCLIPTYPDPNVGAALDGGHSVLVPVGADSVVNRSVDFLTLPRPSRDGVAAALIAGGVQAERAEALAALSRRSFPALLRELDRSGLRGARSDVDSRTLGLLTLAGRWRDTEEDLDFIARLTDKASHEIGPLLETLSRGSDPFCHQVGRIRSVAAPIEAADIYLAALTAADIARWRQASAEVLLESDPLAALPESERLVAQFRGTSRRYSDALRSGLAMGALLLATSVRPVAGEDGQTAASMLVREIMSTSSTNPWLTVCNELYLLAEAAPDEFLDALALDLSAAQPHVVALFKQTETGGVLGPISEQANLMRALQVLGTSERYFRDTCRALIRLEPHHRNPRVTPNPEDVLARFLAPWINFTSAPLSERTAVLVDCLIINHELGWRLALFVLETNGYTNDIQRPELRDWAPTAAEVTVADWGRAVNAAATALRDHGGDDPSRWALVVPHLTEVPTGSVTPLLEGIRRSATSSDSDAGSLWQPLNEVLTTDREKGEARALDPDALHEIESILSSLRRPSVAPEHAELFAWFPHLRGVERGSSEWHARLAAMRESAIDDALASGLEGVVALARAAQSAGHVGPTLRGKLNATQESEVLSWLDRDDQALAQLAEAYVRSALHADDGALSRIAPQLTQLTPSGRQRALKSVRADPASWHDLGSLDPGLLADYWAAMHPWDTASEHAEEAMSHLLDAQRAWAALDVLDHVRRPVPNATIPADLVRRALDDARRQPSSSVHGPETLVSGALNYLVECGSVDSDTLAHYEWIFFPLLRHNDYVPLALYRLLGSNGDEFGRVIEWAYGQDDEGLTSGVRRQAWQVLHDWALVPGQSIPGGLVDEAQLREWVVAVRLRFADNPLSDLVDETIGQILAIGGAHAPEGWPDVAIRRLLEELVNPAIELGLHIGIRNGRGVTSRSLNTGGEPERALAQRFDALADAQSEWRRITRVLRGVAEAYRRDGRSEDVRRQAREDF
jgi:hypothetical protein